ncbi:hypothetical protein COOONC_19715 [Cooperia oncophora]
MVITFAVLRCKKHITLLMIDEPIVNPIGPGIGEEKDDTENLENTVGEQSSANCTVCIAIGEVDLFHAPATQQQKCVSAGAVKNEEAKE